MFAYLFGDGNPGGGCILGSGKCPELVVPRAVQPCVGVSDEEGTFVGRQLLHLLFRCRFIKIVSSVKGKDGVSVVDSKRQDGGDRFQGGCHDLGVHGDQQPKLVNDQDSGHDLWWSVLRTHDKEVRNVNASHHKSCGKVRVPPKKLFQHNRLPTKCLRLYY
jgi:hypothetical protein